MYKHWIDILCNVKIHSNSWRGLKRELFTTKLLLGGDIFQNTPYFLQRREAKVSLTHVRGIQ